MRIVGQICDYRITRDTVTQPKYGMDGGYVGAVVGVQRNLVTLKISADELDMNGPMGSDMLYQNIIVHPGTACAWGQGYVVTDQRTKRELDFGRLEKERDAYRRQADEMKDELARLKKELDVAKRALGMRGERVAAQIKAGAPARMMNLDVDDGEDK